MSIWTRRTMGLPWPWQSPESSPSSATHTHDVWPDHVSHSGSTRRPCLKAFAVPPFVNPRSFRNSFESGSNHVSSGGIRVPTEALVRRSATLQ